MKTQHLIYFVLGLLLGLLLCYLRCCKNPQPLSPETIPAFYPEIKINPNTREMWLIPLPPSQLKKVAGKNVDNIQIRISSSDTSQNALLKGAGKDSFTVFNASLENKILLPTKLSGHEIKFDLIVYSGIKEILAYSGFKISDGIIWEDKIPLKRASQRPSGPPSCSPDDNDPELNVIEDEDGRDYDVIWPLQNDNCVYLNVDGDRLKFDFERDASSIQNTGSVYYLGVATEGTSPAYQWELMDSGKLVGKQNDRTDGNMVIIEAARGRDQSANPPAGSKVHGFNILYSNQRGAVSGTRTPRE